MKNKVLFIVPPLSVSRRIKFQNHQVPLGFLYIAGVLEKQGFVVKIIDCPLYYKCRKKVDENTDKVGLSFEKIKSEIKIFNPDIVGVSCSFSMFEQDSFDVVDFVKEINSGIMVVVGGAHSSSNPKFVLRNKNIDMVVIGEGEETMLEIAKNFRDSKNLGNIRGTAVRKGKEFRINPPRDPIKDLDSLEPAWHLINFNKYFEHPDNSMATMRKPSITIITSRGCPGNCTFCSVQTVWGRRWRAISAKKVVDQIEYLYSEKGVKHFRINDDNLTLDKKRIIEICNEILRRKIDIKWDTPSGVAMWALDEEVLTAMKNSGYYRITFGIESGSANTLKYIGKNIDLKKAKEIILLSHRLGLWTASFFIIGFPYESKEDIEKTKEFIVNCGINFPFVFIAQPYSGTRMYEDFRNLGFLDNGVMELSNAVMTKYKTKNFSAEQLNNFRRSIYLKFYLKKLTGYTNPLMFYREFISKMTNFEEFAYMIRTIGSLFVNFLY